MNSTIQPANPFKIWVAQLIRFGFIGSLAALVHFSIVLLLIKYTAIPALWANTIGYCIAFNVSYFGHRHVTFAHTNAPHTVAAPRLFIMGGINFIINQVLFGSLIYIWHINIALALLISILFVPVSTFLLSKYWIFTRKD